MKSVKEEKSFEKLIENEAKNNENDTEKNM